MINICFFTKEERLVGFKIEGHADLFSKLKFKIKKKFIKKFHNNKDYICSAVSAAAYMTVIGLNKVLKKDIDYQVNESGFMECLLKDVDNSSENLFQMLKYTLQEIEKEYPGHIIIKIEEMEDKGNGS